MLSGEKPPFGDAKIPTAEAYVELPLCYDVDIRAFVRRLLSPRPEHRLSAQDAVAEVGRLAWAKVAFSFE